MCFTPQCTGPNDCDSGETCRSGHCVIDVNADRDRDGVPDNVDNCLNYPNSDQDDLDQDGVGDRCDNDDDGDGVDDDEDNCPAAANPRQFDRDGNGLGDACEADDDNDGVPDDIDNCLTSINGADPANPDQRDTDGDGVGDRCDLDDDGDGITDLTDACPTAFDLWCAYDLNLDGVPDLERTQRPVFGVDLISGSGRNFPPLAFGFVAAIDENLPSTSLGTVQVADSNTDDTHTFVIVSGNNAGLFTIDDTSGEVSTTRGLNFESATQHVLSVTVTDMGGLSSTTEVTVNVTDVNEAPSSRGFVANIREGGPPTLLGTVVGTDPDAGDVLTYTIKRGNESGLFILDPASGDVSTTGPLDFEAVHAHHLFISIRDEGGLSGSTTVVVNVLDINERPSVLPFNASIDENQPPTVLGTVAASDPDAGDVLTFAISAGNDAGLFAINSGSGQLATTGPLDFEAADHHVLSVTVTDVGGLSASTFAIIDVVRVNEGPSLTGFVAAIDEGEPPTVLGSVIGTDPNPGDVLTYAIISGNGSGLFYIDADSGEVSTTGPLDFEAASVHNLAVTTTDTGGLSAGTIVVVNVGDVNEVPSVLPFNASIDENQPATVLGAVTASDPDDGDVLTFAITSGNDAGLFAIDAATGQLATTGPLDFDDADQHVLFVSVKDTGGLSASAQATVMVNDLDDPGAGSFVEGDLYLYTTDAFPGSTTTKTLVKIDPVKPDPTTDAAKTIILGQNDISDGRTLVTYDPSAQRLVLYHGLPRQFLFVDVDGTIAATLPLGSTAPTPSSVAASCSGRIYYWWRNGAALNFNYLDTDGTIHPVEDGSGQPFTYVHPSIALVTRMIYDRPTNSLILAHSTGDTGDSQTVLTKYPLNTAGTDVVGPVSATSPFNAALPVGFLFAGTEFPTGLSRGPGNTLLVSVSANTNLGSAQFFTVDPTDMSTATFAYATFDAILASVTGTYNHVYDYDAILSTARDDIRTFAFDTNPADVQTGDVLTTGTGSPAGSGAAATLIAIGDTIGGGCP